MSIHLVLLPFEADSTDLCNNKGPCCFSCPEFDYCEQHDPSED